MTYGLRLDALPPLAVTLPLGVEARLGPADPDRDPSPFMFKVRLGFLNLKLTFGGVDSVSRRPNASTLSSIWASISSLLGGFVLVRMSEMIGGGTSSELVGGCGGVSISMLGNRFQLSGKERRVCGSFELDQARMVSRVGIRV